MDLFIRLIGTQKVYGLCGLLVPRIFAECCVCGRSLMRVAKMDLFIRLIDTQKVYGLCGLCTVVQPTLCFAIRHLLVRDEDLGKV